MSITEAQDKVMQWAYAGPEMIMMVKGSDQILFKRRQPYKDHQWKLKWPSITDDDTKLAWCVANGYQPAFEQPIQPKPHQHGFTKCPRCGYPDADNRRRTLPYNPDLGPRHAQV